MTTTNQPPTTTAPTGPSPTQPGIAENCTKFYKAQSGDSCQKIADAFKTFTVNDFIKWNPGVGKTCTKLYASYYYCIAIPGTPDKPDDRPSPTQDGIASDCNNFYKVKTGDQCGQIASDAHISTDDFYKWNPAVKADCTMLLAGYYVCTGTASGPSQPPPATTTKPSNGVATPTPTQAGMVGYCNKFYKVKAGDGCWQIAQDSNVDLDNLYRWNPAVKSDCSGLQANTYICTGTIAFHVKSKYHGDCTGDVHNDNIVSLNSDGPCINTDCQVASLSILADGECADGEVQISYWENANCQGKWFGYGYASRNTCRSLWTNGYKFKSLHLRCAKKQDDCVSKKTCKEDPEPSNNIC